MKGTVNFREVARTQKVTIEEVKKVEDVMRKTDIFKHLSNLLDQKNRGELDHFMAIDEIIKNGGKVRITAERTGLDVAVVANIKEMVQLSGLEATFKKKKAKRVVDSTTDFDIVGMYLQGIDEVEISKRLGRCIAYVRKTIATAKAAGIIDSDFGKTVVRDMRKKIE